MLQSNSTNLISVIKNNNIFLTIFQRNTKTSVCRSLVHIAWQKHAIMWAPVKGMDGCMM